MNKPKPLPPLEELLEKFNYDPETGVLSWRKPLSGNVRPGDRAGYRTSNGYLRVRVGSTHYRIHRLIWKLAYGEDPSEGMDIDHINQDRTDNRIKNLRLVSRKENISNRKLRPEKPKKPLLTPEERKRLAKQIGEKQKKPVVVTHQNGEETYHTSVSEAAKANNVSPTTISLLVTGKYKQLRNLQARYAD